jgi:hypothetical protein
MTRHNLASAYRTARRVAEAIAIFQELLTDRERILGAEHPDTLTTRHCLAVAYRAAGPARSAVPSTVAGVVNERRAVRGVAAGGERSEPAFEVVEKVLTTANRGYAAPAAGAT